MRALILLVLAWRLAGAEPALPAAAAVAAHLDRHLVAAWFPACLDPDGGFHAAFARDWSRREEPRRTLVFQARMTWFAAQVALHRPARRAEFAAIAGRGADLLWRRFWDERHGGLHWEADAAGRPLPGEKHLYAMAFAIYALCAAGEADGEPRHRERARRIFAWIEAHAHDPAAGGYREALADDGTPLAPPAGATTWDRIGGRHGGRSMNCHIHLLEALTALAAADPGDDVRARLREIFLIVRDRICTPGGMHQWFAGDWRPLPGPCSFGHDLETAFLLDEAARALGCDDAPTRAVERALVDHALEFGWDARRGGFVDAGPAYGPATALERVWWVQAEGINGLLLMDARHGAETGIYRHRLAGLWQVVERDLADPEHGGWRADADGHGDGSKGHAWFAAYHSGRALLNLERRLAATAR
ncbi:MAG: AGE family epimerase/isomerase [Planctomycetes bacterium]|nr:AGE family epimerase/isomerase [Planctomycetota bacterium]